MKTIHKLLLIFLIILLPLQAYARIDQWTVVHYAGGAIIYSLFKIIHIKPLTAIGFTFNCGIVWEVYVDGCNNNFIYPYDPRGVDVDDIIATGLGSFTAYLIDNNNAKSRHKWQFTEIDHARPKT